ncbi:MAG TPA: cell envelope biogenesis protein TolA [Pseudolabrys sp.]|jgi:colicin import membrane protein|nr:cell envelope biogenesis protein TolA [Pseudolabrys sp.]
MQMKTASVISTGLHVAVLLWAVLAVTGKTFQVTPAESLPVDLVSEKQFSELTKGVKEAPKPVDQPKPLVEKKDEPKPPKVEDIKAKLTEKPEIKATQDKPPEPQSDAIADKIKKEDKEQKETKAEPKPLPPKRPPIHEKPKPKFEPDKIAALLDKRAPQRAAITGAEPNMAPTMGTAMGNAAKLSQSEIDALRARLMALWNPPVGMRDAQNGQVTIRIRFKRDGTLAAGPQVMTSGSGPQYNAMRDSAVRAVFVGQPYTMLRPDHYDTWKEIDFTFDAKDMFTDLPLR